MRTGGGQTSSTGRVARLARPLSLRAALNRRIFCDRARSVIGREKHTRSAGRGITVPFIARAGRDPGRRRAPHSTRPPACCDAEKRATIHRMMARDGERLDELAPARTWAGAIYRFVNSQGSPIAIVSFTLAAVGPRVWERHVFCGR